MILLNIRIAFKTLAGNKLRSGLTMLGIIIGVASVTTVVALGEGFKSQIQSEIDDIGANVLIIVPGQLRVEDNEGISGADFSTSTGASTLTTKDIKTIKDDKGVEAAAPIMPIIGTVTQGERTIDDANIVATNQDLSTILNLELLKGQFLSSGSKTNQIVIDRNLAERTTGSADALATTYTLRDQRFLVTGVIENQPANGLQGVGVSLERAVFIPFEAGSELNDGSVNIHRIIVRVSNEVNPEEVATRLEEAIKKNHGGDQDFTILQQQDLSRLANRFSNIATQFVAAIASISLLVGGIGIMNIMLVSVAERTREIGLRKAIGASNTNILLQFMIESLILSILGGVFGVVLAYLGVGIIALYTDFSAAFNLDVILLAAGVSAAVGVVAGLWPAWQAARKDPIHSLRHE